MQKERAPHHLSSTEKDSLKVTSNISAGGLDSVICYERMYKDSKEVNTWKSIPW